jgi:hypothetical protein
VILDIVDDPWIYNGVYPVVNELMEKDHQMDHIKAPLRLNRMTKQLNWRSPVEEVAILIKPRRV